MSEPPQGRQGTGAGGGDHVSDLTAPRPQDLEQSDPGGHRDVQRRDGTADRDANETVAPELVFEHVRAEYYLRRVAAGDAEPRDIPLPRAMGERVAIALTHTGAAGGRGQ